MTIKFMTSHYGTKPKTSKSTKVAPQPQQETLPVETTDNSSRMSKNLPQTSSKDYDNIEEQSVSAYSARSSVVAQLDKSASSKDDEDDKVFSTSLADQIITVMNIGDTPIDIKAGGSQFISSAHLMERSIDCSPLDGSFSSFLVEDLLTLIDTELSLLNEYLISQNLPQTSSKDNDNIEEEPVFEYSSGSSVSVLMHKSFSSKDDEDDKGYSTMALADQNTTVMNIGDTPIDAFLQSLRAGGSDFICSAYLMERSIDCSPLDGSYSTCLVEHIFTLIDTQLILLNEYLISSHLAKTETGDAVIVDALLNIFRILRVQQSHCRDFFFRDVDSCIASANDFLWMSDKMERLMGEMRVQYPRLSWNIDDSKDQLNEWELTIRLVEQEASQLIHLFQQDAVLTAQRSALYIIQSIQWSTIPSQLFSYEWEEIFTHNEVAKKIVRTFAEQLSSLQPLLATEYLYHKILTALVRSTVCFYIQCFVVKADRARRRLRNMTKRNKTKYSFICPQRAILRMSHDLKVFEEFFLGFAEGNPTLQRIIANDLSVLQFVVLECMSCAAGQNRSDILNEFIMVVHKRTGEDFDVTRHFLSDLYVLLGSKKEYLEVEEKIRGMQQEHQMTGHDDEKRMAGTVQSGDNAGESNFHLDKMLRTVYEDRILQEKMSLCDHLMVDVICTPYYRKKESVNLKEKEVFSDGDESDESHNQKSKTWQKRLDQLKKILLLDVL